MTLASTTADISIVDPNDSTEIPFMLVRDKNNVPQYQEDMLSPLSMGITSDLASDAAQDPRQYAPLAKQTSFIAGYGKEWFESSEPRRYLASYGIDCSEDGVVKVGPPFTSLTLPTIVAFTPITDGLETWTSATDLTDWTETDAGAGSIARESTTIHGGTYSARLVGTDAGGNSVEIARSATWNNDFRSKRFIARVWYNQDVANGVRVKIYDGIGTTTTTSGATTGSWVEMTVVRQLASNATELTVKVFGGVAGGVTAYVDDVTLVGYTQATPTCYADYNGTRYVSSGDILMSASGDTLSYVNNFGDTISNLLVAEVSGTNYLFVCTNPSTAGTTHEKIWYYDGTTWTQATGTNAQGELLDVNAGTFYLVDKPNTIRTQTNPLTGNFSTAYTIGAAETDITWIGIANGDLQIWKEDGWYNLDTAGTVVPVAPDLKDYFATSAGKNACVANGKVYAPMAGGSLIEADPASLTWVDISPSRALSASQSTTVVTLGIMSTRSQTDFDGDILAVTPYKEFLYVLQDNGSTVNLFKGIYGVIDKAGWAWHPVAATTLTAAQGDTIAFQSSTLNAGDPRIYVGNATGAPGYYKLTAYATSGTNYLVTSWYAAGRRHIAKVLYNFIAAAEQITANQTIVVAYQMYGDTSWTTLTTINATTDNEATAFFTNTATGMAIRFKFTFATNSASASPLLISFKAQGKFKDDEIPVILAQVKLQDNQMGLSGVRDGVLASRKKTCLDNAVANLWPVTMYDIDGTTRTVDVLSRKMVGYRKVLGGSAERIFDVVAQKVTLS